MEIKKHIDYSICKSCGGECCKRMPGSYHPADFERQYGEKISIELLVKIFQTNIVAVDWMENDPRLDDRNPILGEISWEEYEALENNKPKDALDECYYLRPKRIGIKGIQDPAWRGVPCINWHTETGCSLSEEQRPYGCLQLIPSAKSPQDCDYEPAEKADKKALAIEWIPYQQMIEQALKIMGDVYDPLNDLK